MKLALLLLTLCVAAIVALVGLLDIAPPRGLSMAAGWRGSGYEAVAQRYRAILAEDDIALTIVETAGSVENAALLESETVDVALVQGGVAIPADATVEALAAVFVEPLLIFHRLPALDAADPTSWSGLRVAAGAPGGGTRAAVEAILTTLGLEEGDPVLEPLGGADAADALLAGDLDVAVFVAPFAAPYLPMLLNAPGVTLAPIRDAEALARRLSFVRMVDIPPAGIDYVRRVPQERVPLAAMVAQIVGQEGLHPALVDRLIAAAQRIHAEPSLLSPEMSFPAHPGVGLPVNAQAAALLLNGPSPLDRWLPYWVAAQINLIVLLLLPIVVLLLPLIRAVPTLYVWRMRARVYRLYEDLADIDRAIDLSRDARRLDALSVHLDKIEIAVQALRLPVRYREYAYTLRLHINLVRQKLSLSRSAVRAGDAAP